MAQRARGIAEGVGRQDPVGVAGVAGVDDGDGVGHGGDVHEVIHSLAVFLGVFAKVCVNAVGQQSLTDFA